MRFYAWWGNEAHQRPGGGLGFGRPLILSILEEGESYGYAIIQRVKELSGGHIEWTDGMLYPILHRPEEQATIRSHWGSSDTGRKREYYALETPARAVLKVQKEQRLLVQATLSRLLGPQHGSRPANASPRDETLLQLREAPRSLSGSGV